MKQNERLLVYAVTGFLALILIVAVVFGDSPAVTEQKSESASASLTDILKGDQPEASEGTDPEATSVASVDAGASTSRTGLNAPPVATFQEPKRIPPPSPESLVRQKLGGYTRDRIYRMVQVQNDDGWERLARRWCGDGSYVDEIKCLNEDKINLRPGETVTVPWIDDEVLLASLEDEARPSPVSGEPVPAVAAAATGASPTSADIAPAGYPVPAVASDVESSASSTSVGVVEAYTVKDGDNLWKVLQQRFESPQIPALIERCKELNPGKDVEDLRPGEQIKLPRAPE